VIAREGSLTINSRRAFLVGAALLVAFVVLRAYLHNSPGSNFNVGAYNIHHLFTGLLLVTAGAVLASITFRLFNRGYVQLQECSGRSVAEAGLLDFFMWHFLNIVPLLQLNSLLRWKEPYCFQQGRVGLMILAFQALVVIPSFNTIRFYWKNRKTPREFIYDPHWQPDAD